MSAVRPKTILERDLPLPRWWFQERRERLRAEIKRQREAPGAHPQAGWLARSYPILSVLAPAQKTHEGKIEYPGDPMCLYGTLSIAIAEVQKSKLYGFTNADAYNDLCPQWGYLPSTGYRSRNGRPGPSDKDLDNTDETVFDPRVWNARSKKQLTELLTSRKPSVVLISAVSCAHRYALDIAKTAKETSPETLVVLGGRHADETIRFNPGTASVDLDPSATFNVTADGRAADCVDFVLAGECYWSIDLFLKAISLAMDLETKVATVERTVEILRRMPEAMYDIPGRSVIGARVLDSLAFLPLLGRPFDMAELPNPYDAFAIRARFPIFKGPKGNDQLTAHVLTTTACPYQCNFCSEGVGVVGRLLRTRANPVVHVINRIKQCVGFGAEAAFFDDSVMFAGNIEQMREFSLRLAELRNTAGQQIESCPEEADTHNQVSFRLANFQWGAQLTGEFLASFRSEGEALALLADMRQGGCTYLYFGLESLADEVIKGIHKNRHKEGGPSWEAKLRMALLAIRKSGLRAGTAVLFGLEGETRATIDKTIARVGKLIDEGLVEIASPSILTYHPGTAITRLHGMTGSLDYHTSEIDNSAPYLYFEQAFPGVVSKLLSIDDIWHIHRETETRWGHTRNATPMVPKEFISRSQEGISRAS